MRRGAGDAEKSGLSSSGAAGGAGGASGISSKGLSADSVLRSINEEPPSARAAHGDPLFPKVRARCHGASGSDWDGLPLGLLSLRWKLPQLCSSGRVLAFREPSSTSSCSMTDFPAVSVSCSLQLEHLLHRRYRSATRNAYLPLPLPLPLASFPCLQDLGGGSMGVRDLNPVPQSAPSLVSPHGDARQPLFRDVVPPPEIMSSEPAKAKAGSGGVAGSQQRDVLGSGSGFPGQSFGSGSGSGLGR